MPNSFARQMWHDEKYATKHKETKMAEQNENDNYEDKLKLRNV